MNKNKKNYLKEIKDNLINRNFEKVKQIIKKIKINNKNADFINKIMGDMLFINGNFNNAMEYYQKIKNKDWDVSFNLALIFLSEGKIKEAIEYFQNILKMKINLKDSFIYANKYKNINNLIAEIYLYLGILNKTLGKNENAIEYFKNSIKYDKNNIFSYVNLGDIYNNNDNYDEAIKIFSDAILLTEESAKKSQIYNDLGIVQLKKGIIEEAIKSFKRAIELNPSNTNAIHNLGLIYVRSGMEEKIKEDIKSFVSKKEGADIIYNLSKSIMDITKQSKFEDIEMNFIGDSIPMIKVKEIIVKAANSDGTVFIQGENGTGKELVARAIHQLSSRKNMPFIVVNCGALPETLLESELFGYEKGSFTGAYKSKPGRFELANNGTIFLDEIGDISPAMQVKLLRVVEQKEFERIGGVQTIKADVRIIAATNKDIKKLVSEGKFREDLFYRLYVLPVFLPPLRERGKDILALANYFLKKSNEKYKKNFMKFTDEVVDIFFNYDWPGNVRQMENVIEQIVILYDDFEIKKEYLPEEILKNIRKSGLIVKSKKIEDEKEKIIEALEKAKYSKIKAAEILGISRVSLWKKIKKYKIG